MTVCRPAIFALLALATAGVLSASNPAPAAQLAPVNIIPFGQVTGRITDLQLDYANQRLFVLEQDAGAVAVVSLQTGIVTQTIRGLLAPQGLAHEPPNGQLYVAFGGGKLAVLQGVPLQRTTTLDIGPDPTAPYYDAGSTRLYLGYGHRAIAVIDTAHDKALPPIGVDGDPGPLAFESQGTRLFAGAIGEKRILVADRAASRQLGSWSMGVSGEVAALALDEDAGLLVAAFRRPAGLGWFDLEVGTLKGQIEACAEPGKLIADSFHARLYLTCGEGRIEIFQRETGGGYSKVGAVKTEQGATAALISPNGDQLYLGVPAVGGRNAEVRIYAPED